MGQLNTLAIERIIQQIGGVKEIKRRMARDSFFVAIKIGVRDLRTPEDFVYALEQKNIFIAEYVLAMMNRPQFTIAEKPGKLRLALLNVADLGFKTNTSYKKIIRQAEALGLKKCPAEIGPQLALEMKNTNTHARIMVAMDPIRVDNTSFLFFVRRLKKGWCLLYYQDKEFAPENQFVFVIPEGQAP